MNSLKIKNYFNKASENYSENSNGFPWSLLRGLEAQAFLNSFLKNGPKNSLLEIGVGTGFYTKHFLDSGYELACLDISDEMLKKLNLPKVKMILGNVEETEIQNQYDVILMLGIVEFLESPWNTLRKIKHSLNEEGRLYIFFPRKNFFGFFYKLFHASNGLHIHLFSKHEIIKNLKDLGIETEYFQHAGLFNFILRLKSMKGAT
jgi:SAM-dependent methyltransferase